LVQELIIEGTPVAVAQESPFGFLGGVVWYSVRKQVIPHEDFEALCDKEGVPEAYRPTRTRPSDAFKSAVRVLESRDYIVDYETTYDAVGKRTTDSSVMLVVSRVHDTIADALPVRMKVRYTAQGTYLTFDGGTPEMQAQVEAAYELYRNSYRDEDIRKMVSDAIHGAFAVSLKQSGGVYFILQQYLPGIEAVARVVDQLPGCEMVSLPVIDREPERKTLIKQYEKATLERLGQMMVMVKEVVDKGERIVPSTFKRFYDEAQYLLAQRAKYEDFLNIAMGKVEVEMQALDAYLGKLSSLIEEDKPAKAG